MLRASPPSHKHEILNRGPAPFPVQNTLRQIYPSALNALTAEILVLKLGLQTDRLHRLKVTEIEGKVVSAIEDHRVDIMIAIKTKPNTRHFRDLMIGVQNIPSQIGIGEIERGVWSATCPLDIQRRTDELKLPLVRMVPQAGTRTDLVDLGPHQNRRGTELKRNGCRGSDLDTKTQQPRQEVPNLLGPKP